MTHKDSWVSINFSESPLVSRSLNSLYESQKTDSTHKNSFHLQKVLRILETSRDLQRLMETQEDSWRLMETHESP